jgi:hypothetical protein
MSDNNGNGGGYGKPPKKYQWKKGQSGNPSGRPKNADRPTRVSMEGFRGFIMNASMQPVTIRTPEGPKDVPKLHAIVTQLHNKAAAGDMRATKMVLELTKACASENDQMLYDWALQWTGMQEKMLKAKRDIGSLEHYDAMYQYYMFKKDIRAVEGVDRWPIENDEPYDNEDWIVFIENHEYLKRHPNEVKPWPPKYPSDNLDEPEKNPKIDE